MAKNPDKQEPKAAGTETTETSQSQETPKVEEVAGSTPPEKTAEEVVSEEDRANQRQFIEEFDNDDEFSQEGAPVKTAEAKAPAQNEASDEPELDAEGKPKVAAPPAKDGEPTEKKEEVAPPVQPKQTPAVEEPIVVATPEQTQERYVTWRKETEELLTKQHYALKPEQIDELDQNPGEFISRMMSKVYLDAVTAVTTQVVQSLPGMVRQINEQAVGSDANEGQFFERWPKLKEHKDTVLRFGAVYRQLNPSTSMDDFINEVGAQAMVALRIPPDGVEVPNGGPPVRVAPFKPAAQTPAGGAPIVKDTNVFSQLADEFDEDLGDT